MPIRRAAGTAPQDTTPKNVPEKEESASTGEEQEVPSATPEAEGEVKEAADKTGNGETPKAVEKEKKEEGEPEEAGDGEEKGETEKDAGKEKEKVRKIKRTIPAWATMSSSRRPATQKAVVSLYNQPKVDDILVEAIQACQEKSGASSFAVTKYIMKKYASLELEKRKFLLKKALTRLVQKGVVKQLKGKGFSGSFSVNKQSKSTKKAEPLGDSLPLIITRLCEPKEASYFLIKKYLEQHFPQLNVEQRPDVLKSALQKAVERGHLEQITGKGASGTFQLKRVGDKPLLKGGPLEDAIVTAITAMNEPKTCSIVTLRKFLLETHKDSKVYNLVGNLKRTLQRCKMMGWMEQITGNGLNGSYQLCYPYYPSPAVLFPEKQKTPEPGKRKRGRKDDSEEEEAEEDESEEESEEDEEEDEPPPKKRKQKRRPAKLPRPPTTKKRWPASQVKVKGKKPPPAKRPVGRSKKPTPPARKPAPKVAAKAAAKVAAKVAAKEAPPTKEIPPSKAAAARSTASKRAGSSAKPKTPVAKKLTSKARTQAAARKTPVKKAPPKSAVKAKSVSRKSLRSLRSRK
ncbi:heterochromatin protein 1-binding protein 3 isoform X2 [Brienomyrus brachyistius]|uniref:heterochromatin protein 1-binding protein 3 isoform X2 n=1 Tax=Brienomyrus brachyistius TaxID=42636 RepID=UPI0020B45F2F|nr:heterochromatin protein 1-binding protein 3 isoform X2 [Brienomyrus brachyistius]XP_048879445.1 heterochromatin protein 1-binding protein 3 isoform X2 [Brienomyrus brachyistius]XP_048879446.1 heterochromatin protein 1-binding protein 3 isoform X2 [Brienomyrus brachyistius]